MHYRKGSMLMLQFFKDDLETVAAELGHIWRQAVVAVSQVVNPTVKPATDAQFAGMARFGTGSPKISLDAGPPLEA
jgi:hypothetical protein